MKLDGFDCRFGFSRLNYMYYQLESFGGQEYGENPMLFSLEHFGAKKQGSNASITAPGMYRNVEVQRKNSDKFAGRNSATLKS